MSEYEFPQYRKYPNNKHFFKIISKDEFYEIAIMGTHYSIHHKVAKILPDRNLILDLLACENSPAVLSSEVEYDKMLEYCKTDLKEF
jgi:hypothetical protein